MYCVQRGDVAHWGAALRGGQGVDDEGVLWRFLHAPDEDGGGTPAVCGDEGALEPGALPDCHDDIKCTGEAGQGLGDDHGDLSRLCEARGHVGGGPSHLIGGEHDKAARLHATHRTGQGWNRRGHEPGLGAFVCGVEEADGFGVVGSHRPEHS